MSWNGLKINFLVAGTAENEEPKFEIIYIIVTGQGDYRTGCLLDYPYFKKYHKLIAIDLSKQQKLDANAKAIQETFTGTLNRAESVLGMYFIIKKATETVLDFSKQTIKVLWFCFGFNIILTGLIQHVKYKII